MHTFLALDDKIFSFFVDAQKMGEIPPETPLKTVGSVFNLSPDGIAIFTEHRLRPQPANAQSLYGCSSTSGFLAADEDLLQCCEEDRKILETRKVSYKAIADRLRALCTTAFQNEPGKNKPGTIVENKFTVSAEEPTMCHQFCPFSPASDHEASAFAPVKNACGQSNRSFKISNVTNNKSIEFSSLLFHLIEEHNFFEGKVAHRLSPADVIDTLELQPDPQFALSFSPPVPRAPPQPIQLVWEFAGVCPTQKETLESILKEEGLKVQKFCEGVTGVIVPYDLWGRETPGVVCLHVFNFTNEEKSIAGVIEGVELRSPIYPNKRFCFLLNKNRQTT